MNNKLKYSTEPNIVGTWIDGNDIYRKVITVKQQSAKHGIDSSFTIVKIFGRGYFPSAYGTITVTSIVVQSDTLFLQGDALSIVNQGYSLVVAIDYYLR